MRIVYGDIPLLRIDFAKQDYSIWSLIMAEILILIAPFIMKELVYGAFVICVYRILKYDECSFGADYVSLATMSLAFQAPGGLSLLAVLCIVASVWFFLKERVITDNSFILLILLGGYLLFRMDGDVNRFALCFTPLLLIRVLVLKYNEKASVRTAKVYCGSLIVSSVYAFIFRNMPQIQALKGNEVAAFWNSSELRFQGLFQDPNYYMALLVIAVALVIKLRACSQIEKGPCAVELAMLVVFGTLTYSKTFLLTVMMLFGIYIIWQMKKRKYLWAISLLFITVIGVILLLQIEESPLSILVYRMTSASDLSEFTTGRTDIFMEYVHVICHGTASFLFGMGMNAEILNRGTHNFFLEITYYTGILGLILILGYCGTLIHLTLKRDRDIRSRGIIEKYIVLLTGIVLYCTLQGMYSAVTYAVLFLAIMSMQIKNNRETKM